MLLEAIVKYSQRAGCTEEAEALSKAFHVMTVVPNQANDMMDIGRLQGFEGKTYNLFCERGQKKIVKIKPNYCCQNSSIYLPEKFY